MTSYVFNIAKDLILQGDLGLDDPTHGHTSGTGTYAPGTFRCLLLQDGNELINPDGGTLASGTTARNLVNLAVGNITEAQLKECSSTGITRLDMGGAYADATLSSMTVGTASAGTIKWDAADIKYNNIGDTGTQQTIDDLLIVWCQAVPVDSGGTVLDNGASIIPICLITLSSPITTNNGDIEIAWNSAGILTLA